MTQDQNTGDWRKRITRARSSLLLNQPFFGSLALQMEIVEEAGSANPTMNTDGEKLYVNPEFVAKQSDPDLEFIVAHEVMHVGLEHNARVKDRDAKVWNEAADYVVNAELKSAGMTPPKTALINPAYSSLSADEIYAKLMKEKQQQPPQGGNNGNGPAPASGSPSGGPSPSPSPSSPSGDSSSGDSDPDPGKCGGVRQVPGSSVEQAQKLAEQRVRVKQAAAAAKAQNDGKLPDSVKRLLELAKPAVDWRGLLRQFIDDNCSQDYSWSRPSRRCLNTDFYLPGTINDGMSHLVVAIDTSGSIDPPTLSRFFAEVESAAADAAIAKISVIYADARVQSVDTFELGEPIISRPKGGGGTDFADTFKHIQTHMPDAPLVIYFTDLYVSNYGQQPNAATVVWAVTGTHDEYVRNTARTPFGHAIHIQ